MQNRSVDYDLLEKQLLSLTADVPEAVSNLANAAALLWETLPDINWAGFYLAREKGLALGPFMGRPACTFIAYDRGVCGAAATAGRILRVSDVHAFPGHIACDCASNAEIVLPLFVRGRLYGVLDIDSPVKDRFSTADEAGLSRFSRALEAALETAGADGE